jgi:poly(3-hydroxybutyrate) depolymerase
MLPYNGGRGLMTMFMPEAAESKPFMQKEFWANVNDSRPAVVQSTPVYDQTDFVSKDGQNRVREYFVKGGAHAWDGSPSKGWPIVGRPLPGTQFDTSEKIWDFLKDARISRSLADTVAEANSRAA